MTDVHKPQFGQQQKQEPKQERPVILPSNHPVTPVTPEERLSHDFNLEPRTREAHTRQINESFHAPDSLAHSETKEPNKVEAHKR